MKTAKSIATSKGKVVSVHTTTSSESNKRKLTQAHTHPEGITSTQAILNHEAIAQRAKAIWRAKGCPVGQDEQNWYEAERQLRMEMITSGGC